MKKVEVKICMGTTCFIMCNSDLQDIEYEINHEILPYVDIKGSSCLGYCKDAQFHRIPCATIDGKLIENINKNELLRQIEKAVGEKVSMEIDDGK